MGNFNKKGRNVNKNLFKLTSNSISTNSAFSDEFIQNSIQKNIKQNFSSSHTYNSESKKVNYSPNIRRNINISNIFDKNNIKTEKNKIIDLSLHPLNKKKSKHNISPFLSLNNKYGNKNLKIIGLYTEYDSTNNNNKNFIKNTYLFKREEKNNKKRIDIIFYKSKEKYERYKKLLKYDEFFLFNANNKVSIESSKFINYDIIKEKTSDLTLKSTSYYAFKNQLKEKNIEQNEKNFEIEFEDYIEKLNSGNFNIDKELSERPLLYLMKKYKRKLNYNKSYKYFVQNENEETIKSLFNENRFNNSNKIKNRFSSIINILNSKKLKRHEIILEKIKHHHINDKKYKNIIFNNNKNNINKISCIIKTENNLKTELSTSANSKSNFLSFFPS